MPWRHALLLDSYSCICLLALLLRDGITACVYSRRFASILFIHMHVTSHARYISKTKGSHACATLIYYVIFSMYVGVDSIDDYYLHRYIIFMKNCTELSFGY
jgi:hypothetical protein